jgi:hypothetical protein
LKDDDPQAATGTFKRDVELDKPGIVGARWWHQTLVDEDRKVSRRQALKSFAVAGGMMAAVATCSVGLVKLATVEPEKTSLDTRNALEMQKAYGWDFGARGTKLVFNGVAEGPFDRAALHRLPAALTPASAWAKYYVPTLVASLHATPAASLPDPEDGFPPPDGQPFQRLADVLVPVVTPEMRRAYAAGEALARTTSGRTDLAVLADLPGPEAIAFAAGAALRFEPVLLLDNWPHPHGVVPSHLTLAAIAYYQPRFETAKGRLDRAPLFVLDRLRLAGYTEESDRFDNRYYARVPTLDALAKGGVAELLYVVGSPANLPEPDDLNEILSARPAGAAIRLRAIALTDFRPDPAEATPQVVHYGGSAVHAARYWRAGSAPGAVQDYEFMPRGPAPRSASLGKVAVVATASGLVLSAALDRRGSMNRFAGGWSG